MILTVVRCWLSGAHEEHPKATYSLATGEYRQGYWCPYCKHWRG